MTLSISFGKAYTKDLEPLSDLAVILFDGDTTIVKVDDRRMEGMRADLIALIAEWKDAETD